MPSDIDDFLGFRLSPFVRISWASLSSQAVGEPALRAASSAYRQWLEDLLMNGCLPAVLLQVPPWEVPALKQRMLFQGLSVALLGSEVWLRPQDGLVNLRDTKSIWCLAGRTAALAEAVSAWEAKCPAGLRRALGQPVCCNNAHAHVDPRRQPEWAVTLDERVEDWRRNYSVARLGLAPAPWLPCNAACLATTAILSLSPPEGLRTVLEWPMDWSALHGIAQIKTPYFKLVHDVPATGNTHRQRVGNMCHAPIDTPVGFGFPYLSPTRRTSQHTMSFQRGIVHATRATVGQLQLGRVREARDDEVALEALEPILMKGAAQHWPALLRWTPSYLEMCIGSVLIQPRLHSPPAVETTFAQFLREVLRNNKSVGYLQDFPFERAAPALKDDLNVPVWLRSWHEDLPLDEQPVLRTLYLGATGTGSPLHVDILDTSAWNVVIWGAKEWVFCPPTSDGRLLVEPPDLFDPTEQYRLSRRGLDIRLCVQKPGDLLFVPHGWWHQVRNVEPTLAVTANIVNHVNCSQVQQAIQGARLPALQTVGRALSKAIAMQLNGTK